MIKRRSKLKLITKGKSYSLTGSPLYKITTRRKLALILNTDFKELKTLAKDEHNYRVYERCDKRGKSRLIEEPTLKLNRVHTRIASLLVRISLPDYLHSGVKGRSIATNAGRHRSNEPLLTTDIKAFYRSTTREMVFKFFMRIMKCSSDVADTLAKIATFNNHIPTGSRISMPLAFWTNFLMFEDLNAYSNRSGVVMSVYVDDITFSGKRVNISFMKTVKKIVDSAGHVLHDSTTKTRLYGRDSVKIVTGVAIRGGRLLLRNQTHFDIKQDMDMMLKSDKNESIKNRLMGKLNAYSQIEPRFKDKARSVRNHKSR